MFNATNGQINTNGEQTDFISFGKGDKNLIIIPGVGDGLKTVNGMALPFAFLYRELAKDYKVYVFSRPNNLKPDASTSDMKVLDKWSLEKQLNVFWPVPRTLYRCIFSRLSLLEKWYYSSMQILQKQMPHLPSGAFM